MAEPTRRAGRRPPTLTRRLAVRFAATFLALLAALGILLDRTLGDLFLEDLTASLVTSATAVRQAIPDDGLQPAIRDLGSELDLRITLIRTDGVVLADSERDPADMENHGDRPEVRTALAGRTGVASRRSETVGAPFRYVALPPREGVVVRVALPLSIVAARLSRMRTVVMSGAALAGLTGIVAAWLISQLATRRLRAITDSVARLREGGTDIERGDTAELDLLATTLDRMAGELRAKIEQLGDERRTRDLILSTMEEGVALLGPDDRVTYRNAAAGRALGQAESLNSLAPHAIRQLVADAREHGVLEREMETASPVRALRVSAVPLGDSVLIVVRDVTRARRLEATRQDFVANASHELKTPVASIHALAETLDRAIVDDPTAARAFVDRLQQESARLGRLVADLLDLSRLETGQPEMAEVELDRVAGAQAERLSERAEAAGLVLDRRLEPRRVRGSAGDLGLLIANLLDNAIRFTPAGGRVVLSVRTEGTHAVIEVTDTGGGIPSRDLPRIFERFFRVDPARSRETGGTGLGLAIAKHVAEEHGGRIEVESELGRGSTFRVSLPVSPPARPPGPN